MRALLPWLLALGCAKDPDGPEALDLVGRWRPVDDPIFNQFQGAELAGVDVRADGAILATWTDEASGLLYCADGRWDLTSDDALLLHFEYGEITTLLLSGLFGVERVGDTLTLTDAVGQVATWTAFPDYDPALLACRSPQTVEVWQELPEPDEDTSLSLSGDTLWYGLRETDALQAVGTDGVLGPTQPMPVTGWTRLLWRDDDRSWFPDPWDPTRMSCRTTVDDDCGTLDTAVLGQPMAIRGVTSARGHLILAGDLPTGGQALLEIDPAGPSILFQVPLAFRPAGLAWDGEWLWTQVDGGFSPSLARFDLDDGSVSETWELGAWSHILNDWQGLAVHEGSLWLLLARTHLGDQGAALLKVGPL